MSGLIEALSALPQAWPLASAPRPIVVIGAGSIVRDAHLPVYRRLGLPVAGIFDINADAARDRAAAFGIPRVFASLGEALAEPEVVFDLAVPPGEITDIIGRMAPGAPVLMQKPMGRDLEEARRIREICRARGLRAAVNFQLRFAPNMLVLAEAVRTGWLGKITDIDVRLAIRTPWEYWPFLKGLPRLEVLNHSVHYLDVIRSIAGEPAGVYARGAGHPDMEGFPDVRTSIILDYGHAVRCSLILNHTHDYGPQFAVSELKVEGTDAAVIARMGVNLDYPRGRPDELLVAERGAEAWQVIPLRGSWFTEAFEGPISNLQRFVSGDDRALVSGVEDAFRTMAVVEACYESSASGGTPVAEE
jgi:predicted dehydrogenase